MKAGGPELFEQELARLRPAPVPEDLRRRLNEVRPAIAEQRELRWRLTCRKPGFWFWLRVALPAGLTVCLAAFLVWRLGLQPGAPLPPGERAPRIPVVQADQVEIDQKLVNVYDAITELPDGKPVRLRCREWSDSVVLRDSHQGVVIEKNQPRFEVVPVRFEIY